MPDTCPDTCLVLTEKEKDALRLILRGHDAKSMARELELSVHTINERLRNARRKLGVTSSKEAARLLLEEEADTPQLLVPKRLGEAADGQGEAALGPPGMRIGRLPIIGGILMTFLLALLAVAPSLPLVAPPQVDTRTEAVATADAELEAAAREWLALVDAADWRASYLATGSAFRELNTAQVWEDASLGARVPLGAVTSREATNFEWVPTPPAGHAIVRFRTSFANQPDTVETISLARENGELRVVGYIIG